MSGDPSIERKVAVLSAPDAYPHAPERVDVEETHMAWVFLAGDRVYKMKKPVRYAFLDFSTAAARAHFVAEEIRLNRRLAPTVYLGAVALTLEADGTLRFAGAGRAVEWLVEMRRLPGERMLDRMVAAGAIDSQQIERLAARLIAFYRGLGAVEIAPEAYLQRFADQHAETRAVLTDPQFSLDGRRVAAVLDGFEQALAAMRPALEERVRAGRIVEGHGDLRPEHVCLCDPLAIIDCLEFDRSLRLVDPFDEIAFLGLECGRIGADWILPLLRRRLSAGLEDPIPDALLALYWRYRALLRARLALLHLSEPDPRQPEKWRPLAWRYIGLAEAAAVRTRSRAGR